MVRKELRIALVAPNNPGTFRSSKIQKENLGLGYLAAQIMNFGFKVNIYDARLFGLTPKIVCEEIIHFNPDIIGISLIAEEAAEWSAKFTSLLKQNDFKSLIVLGGYFPSLQPQRAFELIPEANLVVVGEGEITFLDVVCKLKKRQDLVGIPGTVYKLSPNNFFHGQHRPVLQNLDDLSFPYRYAINHISEISIEGSRGCFNNCTFCAVGPHFNASPHFLWRGRSPENIIKEMLALKKTVPQMNYYRFVDPDFMGARRFGEQRLFRLAELLKKFLPGIKFFIETRPSNVKNRYLFQNLKEAGLSEVYIGIESGSEKILTQMRKGFSLKQIREAINLLDELNINYQYGFMMFTPWSNEEDVVNSVALLREIRSVQIDKLFYDMHVVPGTPAIKQIQELEMKPLERMVGIGYLECAPSLIKQLRLIGSKLINDRSEFLTELWFPFQTIRPYLREGENWAKILEKKLSALYLDIFVYCLEEVKKSNSEGAEAADIILTNCISRFRPDIAKITNELLRKEG